MRHSSATANTGAAQQTSVLTSLDKAKLIINQASREPANISRYEKAILKLSEIEREHGNIELSDFLKDQVIEALFISIQ